MGSPRIPGLHRNIPTGPSGNPQIQLHKYHDTEYESILNTLTFQYTHTSHIPHIPDACVLTHVYILRAHSHILYVHTHSTPRVMPPPSLTHSTTHADIHTHIYIHSCAHTKFIHNQTYLFQPITKRNNKNASDSNSCLLYTSPSPRDGLLSRMPSSA